VIGDGSELERLRRMATPNVSFLGYQSGAALKQKLERARAFLYAAREGFGIVMAEAQAAGWPVIAYGQGGAAEIVRGLDTAEPTGLLFDEQTADAAAGAIEAFDRLRPRIQAAACRENARRFTIERFRQDLGDYVDECWDAFSRE